LMDLVATSPARFPVEMEGTPSERSLTGAATARTKAEATPPLDEPGRFEPLEKWKQFLTEVKSLPDFMFKPDIVQPKN
jgi:hypothetical protein